MKLLNECRLYNLRAKKEAEGSDERKKYAELALAEYDAIIEVEYTFGSEPTFLWIKLNALRMAGKPEGVRYSEKDFISSGQR